MEMEQDTKNCRGSSGASSPTMVPSQFATDNPQNTKDDEIEGIGHPNTAAPTKGLRKVLSRTISRTSSADPGPPPDGGLQAWTQALVGHIVVFNTWGYISSFGVFQTYYATALNHPPSDISWVGSVQIFFLFFVGTFSGRATDAGWFRSVFTAGSLLLLIGVFMTSLSTEYWQLFLAQGVCTGLGNGLLFCPALSLLSTYFTKKRSLAIGIAASGSATGGLIFPAIVEVLLPKIGFPWTVRVLGFVMLGLQAVALTLAKTRLPPRKTGPLVEWGAFKELPYTLFAIGWSLLQTPPRSLTDCYRHVPKLLGSLFCFLLCEYSVSWLWVAAD